MNPDIAAARAEVARLCAEFDAIAAAIRADLAVNAAILAAHG